MNWIDRYQITVYPGRTPDEKVLHSPLARRQTVVKTAWLDAVKDLAEPPAEMRGLTDYIPFADRPHVAVPDDYTLLTVLPNNRCNFACSYCYSAGSRNTAEIEPDVLRTAIDYFIDTKRTRPNRRRLTISFMGGGEPMLSWNTVRDGIIYALGKAEKEGVDMAFRIVTNGSILTDEQIEFILYHRIGLSISFEVLPEVQNLQRKNFDTVQANLRRALAAGIDTQLNVTVTKHNVRRMVETYDTMRHLYPGVKNAMFEPVTAQDLFDSPADMEDFYNAYIEGFMEIYRRGRADGVEITSFPYLRTVYPLRRACPGEFCVTAEGFLTGCYCVATADHHLFNRTHYGNVHRDLVTLDMETYRDLMKCNVDTNPECAACSARWNCGGGCFHLFNSYDLEYRDAVCRFTRRFVEAITTYRAYYEDQN